MWIQTVARVRFIGKQQIDQMLLRYNSCALLLYIVSLLSGHFLLAMTACFVPGKYLDVHTSVGMCGPKRPPSRSALARTYPPECQRASHGSGQ